MKPGYYYFAHPYSTETEEGKATNYAVCCIRSNCLLLHGYNVFSPVVHSHSLELMSSEMSTWSKEKRWQFWIDIDIKILEFVKFTGIILAPEWGRSSGCKLEYDWFLSHKQPDGKPHEILLYKDIVGD